MELTSLLFNLIRVPTFEQRRMIMAGCVWLASLTGMLDGVILSRAFRLNL